METSDVLEFISESGGFQIFRPVNSIENVQRPGDIYVTGNKFVNVNELIKVFSNGKKCPSRFVDSNLAKELAFAFEKEKGFFPMYSSSCVDFSFAIHAITWANAEIAVSPLKFISKKRVLDRAFGTALVDVSNTVKKQAEALLGEFVGYVKNAAANCAVEIRMAEENNSNLWKTLTEKAPGATMVTALTQISIDVSRDILTKRMEATCGAFVGAPSVHTRPIRRARACKDTSAMIAKMSFASDVGLCERKRQAWAALLKQQPKESLVKRTEAEKKAKRAEKNKIYQELKKKNNGKACVYTKDMKLKEYLLVRSWRVQRRT
eukprot:jgi/Mesvir1/6918/Mv09072-RA.1